MSTAYLLAFLHFAAVLITASIGDQFIEDDNLNDQKQQIFVNGVFEQQWLQRQALDTETSVDLLEKATRKHKPTHPPSLAPAPSPNPKIEKEPPSAAPISPSPEHEWGELTSEVFEENSAENPSYAPAAAPARTRTRRKRRSRRHRHPPEAPRPSPSEYDGLSLNLGD